MNSWNLRPMWDALLDVYNDVLAVCEKHKIPFWVIGGTALGAMRHQGFIPWDDDFDIAMLRDDYERFWKVAAKDLPAHLKWTSVETDDQHPFSFGKVRDTRKDFLENLKKRANLNFNQGLYIDVFPIDGQPQSLWGLWLFKLVKGRLYWLLRHIGFISEQKKRILYTRYLKHIPVRKTDWVGVADADSRRKTRCYWPKKWFVGCVYMPFENVKVPLPNDPEGFIEKHYRNWKALPPEKNRVPSHQELAGSIVDF